MHKARVAVGSPPSAPLNGITELFDNSPTMGRESLVCQGILYVTTRVRVPSMRTQPHHAQLRKKRIKHKKEPVWRSSTGTLYARWPFPGTYPPPSMHADRTRDAHVPRLPGKSTCLAAVDVRTRAPPSATSTSSILYLAYLTSASLTVVSRSASV